MRKIMYGDTESKSSYDFLVKNFREIKWLAIHQKTCQSKIRGSYPAHRYSKYKLFLHTISAFYQRKTGVAVGYSLMLQEIQGHTCRRILSDSGKIYYSVLEKAVRPEEALPLHTPDRSILCLQVYHTPCLILNQVIQLYLTEEAQLLGQQAHT